MSLSESDLAEKYGLPIERLIQYAQAGLLTVKGFDGHDDGRYEKRVALIAKAESVASPSKKS